VETACREVIDLYLVMQRQRMVAIAPVVSDARLAVHESACRPAICFRRAAMQSPDCSAADDQDGRIMVGIFGAAFRLVESSWGRENRAK